MFSFFEKRRARRVRAQEMAVRYLAKFGSDAIGALVLEAERSDSVREERIIARLAIREIKRVL